MDDIDNNLNNLQQPESDGDSGGWSLILKILSYIFTFGIALVIGIIMGKGKRKKVYSEGYKDGSEDTSKASKTKIDNLQNDIKKSKKDFETQIEKHNDFENELINRITELEDKDKLSDNNEELSNFSSCKNLFTKGVNLSNWLEVNDIYQIIDDYYTPEDFENIKELGCDVVRIPINFENICVEENDYTIPGTIINILDKVISLANKLNLYVIIDYQNRTDVEVVDPIEVEELLNKIWIQIIQRYKDESEYIIFELMNEPYDIEFDIWNDIIVRLHERLREIDQDHYLIISGTDHNSIRGIKSLPDFDDNKVIYSLRLYGPINFERNSVSWCRMEKFIDAHDSDNKSEVVEIKNEDVEAEENGQQDNYIEDYVNLLDEYMRLRSERKVPIFCSEFGCCAFCIEHDKRIDWYSIVVNLLQEREIPWICWDYNGSFGIFRIDANKKVFRMEKPTFPDELDTELLETMGLIYDDSEEMRKNISRVLSNEDEETRSDLWNEVFGIYNDRYFKSKKYDKYTEFITMASDMGVREADERAIDAIFYLKKDYNDFEKRLIKLYESYDTLPRNVAENIINMINTYIMTGNKVTEGMENLVTIISEHEFSIENDEKGYYYLS